MCDVLCAILLLWGGGGGIELGKGGGGCLALCEGSGGAFTVGLAELGGTGGGNEGVDEALCIPCEGGGGKLCDGGGGKGRPLILGGRVDPSAELCLLRAPVLLETPAEVGPLPGGGGGVLRGPPGEMPPDCQGFVPPEVSLFPKALLKFATESETLFLLVSLS